MGKTLLKKDVLGFDDYTNNASRFLPLTSYDGNINASTDIQQM